MRSCMPPGFAVAEIESRQVRRNPFPPFTTSTLQQEASRKLGLSASRTMQIAQRLYEGVDLGGETVGLITYMRTDGVAISGEAIAAARQLIGTDFGARYVPDAPRVYRSPAKNAQEAHEAIRPTDLARKPADVARLSRPRPAPALRADLEAHPGEPDGLGVARAGHRRHRRPERPAAAARHRLGRAVRRVSGALPGRPRRHRQTRRAKTAGCRRCARASGSPAARSCRASISPSRRRAIPRRAWSKSSRSSASAGPRPMPRSCRCCRTAPMSGSTSGAFCRRTAAGWSPPF